MLSNDDDEDETNCIPVKYVNEDEYDFFFQTMGIHTFTYLSIVHEPFSTYHPPTILTHIIRHQWSCDDPFS